MDTQVINKNATNGNAKETLKKGAALAGSAALGAGAVVSADIVRGDEELELAEAMTPEQDAQTVADHVQAEGENDNPAAGTEHVEHAASAATTASQTVNHPSEPQPQTSNAAEEQTQSTNTTTTQQTDVTPDVTPDVVVDGVIDTNDIPDVDPDLVAQDITDDVIMVDPTDNDMANLDIAAVGKIETIDGQVLTAAQFTGDNGESLYAVDVDGDNTYDIVTDETGNIMAEVPTTLTVSDSENIASVNHGDTGYLAHTDTDNTPDDTQNNPMDDVVDLS